MCGRAFIRRLNEKYGDPTGTANRAALPASAQDPASRSPDPGRAEFSVRHVPGSGSAAELVDRFLADASIPLAVFLSRALGRDFVRARDPAALEVLTDDRRSLAVLFFSDCEHGASLGREGLRVLLDLRERFGPEVAPREVRSQRTLQ